MMSAAPPPVATATRALALAIATAPVFMLVAVVLVVPADGTSLSVPVLLGVLALVAAGFALAEVLGYRAPALPLGLDEREAREQSVAAYRTRQIFRVLFTEGPVIVALALTFALDAGPWPMVVATVVGVPSMLFHLLPTRRSIEKVRLALESGGARSYLPEAFEV